MAGGRRGKDDRKQNILAPLLIRLWMSGCTLKYSRKVKRSSTCLILPPTQTYSLSLLMYVYVDRWRSKFPSTIFPYSVQLRSAEVACLCSSQLIFGSNTTFINSEVKDTRPFISYFSEIFLFMSCRLVIRL